MINDNMKWYSGILCKLNGDDVNFRAEIAFNEHHQSIITVYNVFVEYVKKIKNTKLNSAILYLENKEYISIFDFYIEQSFFRTNFVDEEPVCEGAQITLISSNAIKGAQGFSKDYHFSEINMEITEGHELIGKCPYRFKNDKMHRFNDCQLDVSIKIEPIVVNTIIGRFEFGVFPNQYYKRDSFSINFEHKIRFIPTYPIKVENFHTTINKVSSFFFLLCGETVTVNRMWLVENKDDNFEQYEFIGYCNFIKEKLRKFEKHEIDSISFRRVSIFKLSDFANLEFAMNYWFEHYDDLYNAHQAYIRIIQEEDVNIIPINRFLAAMQLIEGYSQAYVDEEQEIAEFTQHKEKIIALLKKQEDIDLINNGLGFSSISFRKATTNFLYEGINYFEKMSKSAFGKKYDKLIQSIVDDRNFYTHSSNRTQPVLSIEDILNIGTLTMEIYRILILGKMGLPEQLLRCRMRHDFRATDLLKSILNVEINDYGNITEFDAAMMDFTDPR